MTDTDISVVAKRTRRQESRVVSRLDDVSTDGPHRPEPNSKEKEFIFSDMIEHVRKQSK
jgi:hypothetical protein